uniref:Ovule protein n=1 Tax=Ascaris lumbricoides TaxID=6252 RepID=A0A0M3I834_ASCLU
MDEFLDDRVRPGLCQMTTLHPSSLGPGLDLSPYYLSVEESSMLCVVFAHLCCHPPWMDPLIRAHLSSEFVPSSLHSATVVFSSYFSVLSIVELKCLTPNWLSSVIDSCDKLLLV